MTTEKKTTVLVVDDSGDLATILAMLLNSEADITCIGTISSADTLVDTVLEMKPDVVLLDLTMPGRNPLDAMSETAERAPHSRFIVHSGYDDLPRIERAIDRGAWGFVSKHDGPQRVVEAVRTVAAGQVYLNDLKR